MFGEYIMKTINNNDILAVLENLSLDFDVREINVEINLDDQGVDGVDSLDLTNILFGIEEAYDIKIDDESIENGEWSSIEKIVKNINRILDKGN
jgi:acyl carrier protein